jgi:hypothetical protein
MSSTREAKVSAIHLLSAAAIFVIDDHIARRTELVTRLAARGMTPLAPRTPLEAIDLLTCRQLHVNVALLAPSFGHSAGGLRARLRQLPMGVDGRDCR